MPASFDTLFAMAAARKGGDDAVEALLPQVKTPEELAAIPDDRWLSEITRRVFQAGFNWKVIDSKWPGFEAAFHGFDVHRNAMMSDEDLDRLLADKRIVRNGAKIRSVRENAAFLLELAAEHGSAAACLAHWPAADHVGLLAMLKARGARLGGMAGAIALRMMGRDGFILTGDVSAALVREEVVDKPPSSKRDMAAVQAAFDAWHAESGRPYAHVSRVLALTVGT